MRRLFGAELWTFCRFRTFLRGRIWLEGGGDGLLCEAGKQFVEQVVVEVEDALGVNIETVVVGDRDAGPRGRIMQSLVREACMNAAKHGAAPISVYVECGQQFEAYVKDHGPGFSLEQLDQVPADRHGVRNSLLKRAQQAGGSVNIRKLAVGTEVAIMVPWQSAATSENSAGGHHD